MGWLKDRGDDDYGQELDRQKARKVAAEHSWSGRADVEREAKEVVNDLLDTINSMEAELGCGCCGGDTAKAISLAELGRKRAKKFLTSCE